jgi:hypothetical protein
MDQMTGSIELFRPIDALSLDALLLNSVPRIPNTLRRRVFKERLERGETIPEVEWNRRGRAVERYVRRVLASKTDIIDHVDIKEAFNGEGPDLMVYFVAGFPIDMVGVEVKSSTHELVEAKQKIRAKILTRDSNGQFYTPWKMEAARLEWDAKTPEEKEAAIFKRLQTRRIILLNGGEKDKVEKTPLEIWNDSFYPQLLLMIDEVVPKAA